MGKSALTRLNKDANAYIRLRITPWLDGMGTQNCFISAAFVGLAVVAVFLVLIKYGKSMREKSRVRYWQLVKENMENGVSH